MLSAAVAARQRATADGILCRSHCILAAPTNQRPADIDGQLCARTALDWRAEIRVRVRRAISRATRKAAGEQWLDGMGPDNKRYSWRRICAEIVQANRWRAADLCAVQVHFGG